MPTNRDERRHGSRPSPVIWRILGAGDLMNSIWIAAVALMIATGVPAVSFAHGGHAHKVMGTVSSVDGQNIVVKTTDGKIVTVKMDAKTKITRGKIKVDATSVKVGERVVAEGAEEKTNILATTVQLPAPAATTAKK